MDGDVESDSDCGFKINKAYADNYNTWRQKEELQKLKDKYGDIDGSSSSSESEDETGEALTDQVEQDWLRTLAALKSKDPKIYQKETTFYQIGSSSSDGPKKTKKRKEKPLFVQDYEREIALEKGGYISEESDDGGMDRKHGYFEEQEEIKKSFRSAIESSEDESSETTLFKKRKKTKDEETKEEAEYIKWLKGQKSDLKEKQIGIELEPLKDYWSNPKLDFDEKFLRDYILNKRYLEEDNDRIPTYEEVVDNGEGFSDEEDILDKQEDFERKYNFRFEEPDPEFIKKYPRTIESSMRNKETKRAQKRQEIKDRKKQEKDRKKEELKQLKNLKKQEIMDKIDTLKEISGNPTIGFGKEDLEADFDPAQHDQMMQKYFNDDYYGEEVDEVKPDYTGAEEELQVENWDNWQGLDSEEQFNQEEEDTAMDNSNFNMDCDYDPSEVPQRTKKKKKKSLFYEALNKKKPVFNSDETTFEDYLDEFYKLDYEDVIGDIPCRFKYRKVVPNDYGLSVDDILKCRDKELNAWASLKKMSQYRTEEEEVHDVRVYNAKSRNERKKKNILTSLQKENEEIKKKKLKENSYQIGSVADTVKTQEQKGKKRKHTKSETITRPVELSENRSDILSCARLTDQTQPAETTSLETTSNLKTLGTTNSPVPNQESVKKRKKKHKTSSGLGNAKQGQTQSSVPAIGTKRDDQKLSNGKKKKDGKRKKKKQQISDERLQAYGINPKKFKYMKIHRAKKLL
ncbi:hypothetical protein ScPMuIL_002052 [Solemya velum]